MADDIAVDHRGDTGPGRPDASRSDRLALIALIVALVVAVPVLAYLGRDRWFRYDDWDFLAARHATSISDLFSPHVVHWSTIPILLYRAVWTVFGLHSYLPYMLMSIVSHVIVVALVWVVATRAGVRPWIATATALLLLFFGSGDENILWAFGVTFVLSIAFGLGQLLLSDHDGPLDRRDVLGLLAGFLGLLCSGVAVTMVVVVGVATLTRRGWRVAAFHTAPLAVAYLTWFAIVGHEKFGASRTGASPSVVEFVRVAGANALDRVMRFPGSGWILAALLVVGCSLAWARTPLRKLRRTAAAPIAMLVGSFVFLVIAGLGRSANLATATRYTHVTIALALPAIAIAVQAIIDRAPVTAIVFVGLLVVALVGNIRQFDNDFQQKAGDFQRAYRDQMVRIPRLPLAAELPADLRPDISLAPPVTIGWLRTALADGRLPAPPRVTRRVAAEAELRLVLRNSTLTAAPSCRKVGVGTRLVVAKGGSLRPAGPVSLRYTDRAGVTTGPVVFQPNFFGPYLVANAGPLSLRVASAPGGQVDICSTGGGVAVRP